MSFSGRVKAELTEKKRRGKKDERSLLREAFLQSGTMSDPEKSYHFEIVCDTKEEAERIAEQMRSFSLGARVSARKAYFFAYLKEGDEIADMLRILGASRSLMEFENVRILKEMRGSVNRRVNCETANINKTVDASLRQIEDIRLIEEKKGLSELPKSLREIAELRLQYPDANLTELGSCFTPPIGKSGVNHRLRKLREIAEALR